MLRRYAALLRYLSLEQVAGLVKAKQVDRSAATNVQLVDVRSTAEVAKTGMIPTAVNIPLSILGDVLDEEGPDAIEKEEFYETFGVARPQVGSTQLVFYCLHGVRSAVAVEVAEQVGYTNAYHFSGGWAQWAYTFGGEADGCDLPSHGSVEATTKTP